MASNIKQTLLLRAAKLLHGKKKLAEALRVPEALLEAWMSGAVEMPDVKTPRLAAIVEKGGDQSHGGFKYHPRSVLVGPVLAVERAQQRGPLEQAITAAGFLRVLLQVRIGGGFVGERDLRAGEH